MNSEDNKNFRAYETCTQSHTEPGWSLTVDQSDHGMRLDRFISMRLARVSRSRASRLMAIDVTCPLNLTTLKKSTRVKSGQKLWIKRPLPLEDVSQLSQPNVLFEDEHFLVIDKPSGWAVHPTASRFLSTITTWLKTQKLNAEPAHRLDVETSGVLLCTKDKQTEALINESFRLHKVAKYYLAVCR